MKEVGTIKELNLYPVKSMAAFPVETAQLNWHGLNGDRTYAFVQSDKAKVSGFPWLTARELPELLRYQARFLEAEAMKTVEVLTPSGESLELGSSELKERLESLSKTSLSLLKLNRGTHDVSPVSIITTGTSDFIAQQLDAPFDLRRLRMNIVIEAQEARVEEKWLGKTLAFGSGNAEFAQAEVVVQQRDGRCVIVNLDADTGESNPEVLKVLAKTMDACAGVQANVIALGQLNVGDSVYLKD